MASLETLIDNRATDKHTTHSYLPVYQSLMEPKRFTATGVLEIGLGHGGSIKLWNDYFPSAEIHALDINTSWGLRCSLESPRIHVHLRDAYTEDSLRMFSPGTFDILIDDGPHTLESMRFFVQRYSTLLKPDGILVVEDIPDPAWVPILASCLPSGFSYESHDRRSVKGRFDDILFVARRQPDHV